MTIQHIGLIGAGAVGSYMIYHLNNFNDLDFFVVADGNRAKQLKDNGRMINGKHFALHVKQPEEIETCDLLIIAMKYNSFLKSLDMIQKVVKPNTLVLSLMNGVDSEDKIAEKIGAEHLIRSVIWIASTRIGNEITFEDETVQGISMGAYRADFDKRLNDVADLFDQTGIHYAIVIDALHEQWRKYQHNITYNLPEAVLGVGYGAYFDSDHVAFLRDALDAEVRKVAAAEGVQLDLTRSKRLSAVKNDARYSTLQDLDAKRHTEIDMLAGVLMDKAKMHRIDVPYTTCIYHMIKALEEKNDGRFDYA